jgi:signal transduction histidine kinase
MKLKDKIFKERYPFNYHYLIVFGFAVIILTFYYAFFFSLPTYHGRWLNVFWYFFQFEFRFHLIGILLNIPIIYSMITIGLKKSTIIVIILLICITPYVLTFSFRISTLLVSYAMLLVPAFIIAIVKLELLSRAKEKRLWAEKEENRITISRLRLKVQEDERRRLAEELHDGAVQTSLFLASTVNDIIVTYKGKIPAPVEKDLASVKNHSLQITNELRLVCRELMPGILDNLGLIAAIKWLIENLREESSIATNLSVEGSIYDLSQNEKVALFRMVQESLNNIRRHSNATAVAISVHCTGFSILIVINDNGKGFNIPGNFSSLAYNGKLGLIGMYERAQSIGANLEINSQMGIGTTVRILLKKTSN